VSLRNVVREEETTRNGKRRERRELNLEDMRAEAVGVEAAVAAHVVDVEVAEVVPSAVRNMLYMFGVCACAQLFGTIER
jgi:hypothetical protein